MESKPTIGTIARQRLATLLRDGAELILQQIAPAGTAEITSVRFKSGHAVISLRWPCLLDSKEEEWNDPDADQWDLSNPGVEKRFRAGFRKYLLEQRAGTKLSNLLHAELRGFTARFLRAHRCGPDAVRTIKAMEGERRLAGRPKEAITSADTTRIQEHGPSVLTIIKNMRPRIRRWKPHETRNMRMILARYDRDQYPWMRSFAPVFERLHGKPKLHELGNWTALKLAVGILRQEIYRDTGRQYAASAVEAILQSAIRLGKAPPKK